MICVKCKKEKGEYSFRHPKGRKNREKTCKECQNKRCRELQRTRMGGILVRNRKRLYNVTENDLAQMLKMQDYRCASCNDPLSDNSRLVHIDHDHKTSVVRGILCRDCNLALAYGRDDPSRLRAAADYLERTFARRETRNAS